MPEREQLYFVSPMTRVRVPWRLSSMKAAVHPSKGAILFRLPEYNNAFGRLLGEVIHELANQKAPLLAQMPTDEVEHVHSTHVTAPSGEVVRSAPFGAALDYGFDIRDVLDFNLHHLAENCNRAAEQLADAMLDQILGMTNRITDAFGNVAKGDGGDLVRWPVILAGMKKVDIDFDEHGHPILPVMVHSRRKREIVPYPPLSDSERMEFEALMQIKRSEFNARRGSR